MRALALLIAICFAPLCHAETWKVHVYPGCFTSTSLAWSNPETLREKEFRIGVEETSKALQRYCDLRLELVDLAKDADILVTSHHPDSYGPMWSVRHGHVAGLYVYYRQDYVVVSNGWLPARTVQGNRGYWYNFVSNQNSLSGLICHEFGHNHRIIGPSHKYNLSSIFATPPRGLVDLLERRFGKPTQARMMMAEKIQGEPWFPNSELE